MEFLQAALNKENPSQLGVIPSARPAGLRTGPVGKTFQPHQRQRDPVQKKAFGTQGGAPVARRALGGLNVDPTPHKHKQGGIRPKKAGDTFLKPPAPASKPLGTRQARSGQSQKKKITTTSKTKKILDNYPPIEIIPKVIEKEDTFEDIWPTKERPDSFIQEMLQWRPSRIFSPDWDVYCDSDNDSLLKEADSSMEELRIQDLTIEDPEIQLTWEDPDFSEIAEMTLPPLPALDDLEECGSFDSLC